MNHGITEKDLYSRILTNKYRSKDEVRNHLWNLVGVKFVEEQDRALLEEGM